MEESLGEVIANQQIIPPPLLNPQPTLCGLIKLMLCIFQ